MILSNFKISIRNLWKDKGFSFLNILGLAIGITCAGLILLWIEDEVSYDKSIPEKELVFNIPTNQKYEGQWRTFFVSTPGPLAEVLKTEIPEVTNAARFRTERFLFQVDEKSINSRGSYADKDFFEIFGLQFLEGTPEKAFKNTKSIVITKKIANLLFGDTKMLVGKEIKINQDSNYIITGVIEDLPKNSSYSFSWLVPFENFTQGKPWTKIYGYNFTDTFVKLSPGAVIEDVQTKVKAVLPAKTGDKETEAILFSAKDWHLRGDFRNGEIVGGRIEYVRLFSFIALIILGIACINFMNLATARSEKRAKEVGMRKTLGSTKFQLVSQFMTEAMFTAFLSGITSLLLLSLLLPSFNRMIDKNLSFEFTNPVHVLPILLITLVCGFMSGLYPAFYLSSIKPIGVLKGFRKQTWMESFTRKTLVVVQFSISIVFIISTIVVYQQIQHVKNRDIGIVKENLIELPAYGNIIKNIAPIEQELKASGSIQSLGLLNTRILSGGDNTSSVDWQGKSDAGDILISLRTVSKDLFETLGMKIKEGVGFTASQEADASKVLISESLAALMNKEQVLGSTIATGGETYTITGVVKNYLYGDMYVASDPVMFFHIEQDAEYLYLKPAAGMPISKVLQDIERVLSAQNPGYPFEYRFVEDAFNARFKSELLLENLSKIFAGLAIIISCLGLFGLTAFTAEQRKKEIGVRKVLGASVSGIVMLLSLDFARLVLLAFLVSAPIAYYLMEHWLQHFAYRIEVNLWIFFVAGFIAISIALVTLSFHAIKAATANPVKSLKTE